MLESVNSLSLFSSERRENVSRPAPGIVRSTMERKIFEPEHDMFRATARRFFETECAPHAAEWERNGITAREPWLRAGELGLLGWEAPEKFGGQGIKDFRYNAIMTEEQQATGTVGIG